MFNAGSKVSVPSKGKPMFWLPICLILFTLSSDYITPSSLLVSVFNFIKSLEAENVLKKVKVKIIIIWDEK